PAGNEAGSLELHGRSVTLVVAQGKIADVNVPLKVVVWNSTVPPTGTVVTEGSNHLPGTSVSLTTNVDSARDALELSVSTVIPRTKSVNSRTPRCHMLHPSCPDPTMGSTLTYPPPGRRRRHPKGDA